MASQNGDDYALNEITMQNEMLAFEETMNIEVGAVKTETVEVENELFGIEQTRGSAAKYAIADETVVYRSKEGNIVEDWRNHLEMQDIKVKLEENDNCENLKTKFEEAMIKQENDDLNDADGEIAVNRIKKEQVDNDWKNELDVLDTTVKLEEDVNCEDLKIKAEEVIIKEENDDLKDASGEKAVNRSLKNLNGQNQHLKTADKLVCTYCCTAFVRKTNLDEHIFRKHPNSVASVSSKIHKCAYCTYQTVKKANFTRHMLKHPETADRYKFITCALCNDTFKDKRALDGHTLEKHPDSIGSISNKIFECTHCVFRTVKRVELTRHSLKHPEAADSYEFKTCIHCNAKYKYKIHLDEHTLRQHPEYFASVTYKIHACIQCSYKTVMKANLEVHMLKHPETADSFKFSTCIHCNVKFKRKISLDNHILRLHPEYIASVSSKIHECTLCAFKTVIKPDLTDHMLKHPETADNYEFMTRVDRFKSNTCIHCNAIFKRKPSLHDHIVRTHPEYIASVSSKIHKCTHCTFKTIKKPELARHMLKHPETADRYNFSIPCVHCSATFNSKQTLIGHMLRRHPNFSGSISTKIYECLHCAYKVNKRDKFLKHILKHR